MNKEEILYEIEKTKHHLTNLEKMLKECENRKWKPKYNEFYYFVSDDGETLKAQNYGWLPSTKKINFYNCFKTEEEAEQEAEKILVRRQLEDIAKRLNKGEEIDWYDSEQPKHCIELYCNDIITNFYFSHKTQGTTYCLDKNFLNTAIKEIGEGRLIKYLRG